MDCAGPGSPTGQKGLSLQWSECEATSKPQDEGNAQKKKKKKKRYLLGFDLLGAKFNARHHPLHLRWVRRIGQIQDPGVASSLIIKKPYRRKRCVGVRRSA